MNYNNMMYGNRKKTGYPSKLIWYLVSKYGLAASNKVLDMGCGDGTFAKAFASIGFPVVRVDKELFLQDGIDQCDFEKDELPYKRNKYDVVFCKSVIEHLREPWNMLSECLRVLNVGGVAILLAPDWNSQWRTFYDDPTHVHPYTVKGIKNTLKFAGFRDVASEKFYQLPMLWKRPWMRPFLMFNRWARESMVLAIGKK